MFERSLHPSRFMIRVIFLVLAALAAVPAVARSQSGVETGVEPGDAIRLIIYQEPDLSSPEILVHEDGTAVFPRLGSVVVVGKEIEALKRDLVEEYSRTLRDPSIDIVVLRRVTISGEVRSPGVYKVDPTMTVTDALALAGGPTANANRNELVLIRRDSRSTLDLEEPLSVGELALRSGDQLFVPQRSWFLRNWPLVASVVSTLLSVTVLATRL